MNTMHKIQGESMMGHPIEGSIILPSFSITTQDFPEAKDWKVGKKYTVKIEVILSSQSKRMMDPLTPTKNLLCRFDIKRIGLEDASSKEEVAGKKGYE